jgi:hypothetical protein
VKDRRERPIVFAAHEVRAVLKGRKTQARRIVSPQPEYDPFLLEHADRHRWSDGFDFIKSCLFGQPGDRLWVRETWAKDIPGCESQSGLSYRADHFDPKGDGPANPMKWHPSTHMPRWASRIILEITDVRVERLQDIAEADAIAEGMHEFKADGKSFGFGYDPRGTPGPMVSDTATGAFALLWETTNGKKDGCSWDDSPWVWVISFRRIDKGNPENSQDSTSVEPQCRR